jgi:hypothetical protein
MIRVFFMILPETLMERDARRPSLPERLGQEYRQEAQRTRLQSQFQKSVTFEIGFAVLPEYWQNCAY